MLSLARGNPQVLCAALNHSEPAGTRLIHLWDRGSATMSPSSSPVPLTVALYEKRWLAPVRFESYRQKFLNLSGASSV
jgi:hypothetical protein